MREKKTDTLAREKVTFAESQRVLEKYMHMYVEENR